MEDKKLYGVEIKIPSSLQEIVEGYLYLLAPWGWESCSIDRDNIQIKVVFNTFKEANDTISILKNKIPNIQVSTYLLKSQNWLESWKQFFTPINVNNTFVILPSWEQKKIDPALIPIYIYPEMAFGTGHHATTFLCLKMLCTLKQYFDPHKDYFLDLGTGSGILGIACAKLGLKGIGVDIDSHAIQNAKYNITLNQINDFFTVQKGSIEDINSNFSLIIANILANPLIQMRENIKKHLCPNAHLILSGILIEQSPKVISCYEKVGLKLKNKLTHQEWIALHFQNE